MFVKLIFRLYITGFSLMYSKDFSILNNAIVFSQFAFFHNECEWRKAELGKFHLPATFVRHCLWLGARTRLQT